MLPPGSESRWIAALKEGDTSAAQPLWEHFYQPLIALARKMLRTARRTAADEEDVVQNAFQTFFRAAAQGRFPHLHDRDGLWRLLVVITSNKALKQLASEQRLKRGGGTAVTSMGINQIDPRDNALVEVVDRQLPPDFAALVADEYRRLLEVLGDETLRQVALWKLEGYGNREIAAKLSCSQRTVARKLKAIRKLWGAQGDAVSNSRTDLQNETDSR